MLSVIQRIRQTSAPGSVILIRLIVGAIFLSEGIQKFLYPAELGVGRFMKIGLPHPEVLAPFVGVVEIVAGTLLILGLLTRVAALALLIDITVALVSTKIPILLSRGFWGFSLGKFPRYGFWSMAHEARVDFAMFFGLLFLLIVGAGRWPLVAGCPGALAGQKSVPLRATRSPASETAISSLLPPR